MIKRLLLILFVGLVVVAGGAYAYATRHAEIEPVDPPDPASFDSSLVERGEALAGLGNCGVCHTTQGGSPYSGGLALPTPFGTIYTTNITPDAETGIGTWSEEAFIRAMHHGIDREGNQLYPAFPYDYFAKVTEDDLRAIYAYLMSQEPVLAEIPENELGFPYNMRLLLEGWNFLFLEDGAFEPDPERDEEWNRGAYIVEGLGHCGACHSPRNRFGAVARGEPKAYAGARAEGWYVPPLDETTPAPIPWTQIALVNYLIDGWDSDHGIAAGPMRPVVDDLYEQSEDDVFAIAAYVMSLKGEELPDAEQTAAAEKARAVAERLEWGHPENPPLPEDPLLQEGARVFDSQCANCHKYGGQSVPMALMTSIHAPDSANLVQVTFKGVQPAPLGSLDRSMPARAIQISDEEMVALAAFIRERFSDEPAWENVEETVREVRAEIEAGQ